MTITSLTHSIIRQKRRIIHFFWAGVFFVFFIFIFTLLIPTAQQWWDSLGRRAGQGAVVLFCAAITPGIFRRFQVGGILRDLQVVLLAFRRQLGIGMYLLALLHYFWIKAVPAFVAGVSILAINKFELMGTLALLFATPLFLTSNNKMVRFLGKNWQRLHRLVYLIVWLIFAHVLLRGQFHVLSVVLLGYGLAEVVSWLMVWRRARISSKATSRVSIKETE